MESSSVDTVPSFKHFLFALGSNFLLWLLLVGTLQPQELIAGVVVALGVSLVAWPNLGILTGLRFSPAAPLALLRYLGLFLMQLIAANVQLARLVVTPSLPIHPTVISVRTRLRSPLARLLLANSITLTPGTLTVDVQDDHLLVHWVDCPPDIDLATATRTIVAIFEDPISGFLT